MGYGNASFWMKKAEKSLEKKIGKKLFNGTLNIKLEQDYILTGNLNVLHKEEYGGTQEVYIKECLVLGHKSFIVRTEKNSTKNGDHPLSLIEIVSDVNFRKKYNLKDNDKIRVEIK